MEKLSLIRKSISYALIANGVNIYEMEERQDIIYAVRLVCKNCNKPWYMNLTECFLCGAINPYLYRCDDCGTFVSITNASGHCNSCHGTNLHLVCPNPDCISNTDPDVKKEINAKGGVFDRDSGFLISQLCCIYCGNNEHIYKHRKIFINDFKRHSFDPADYSITSDDIDSNSFLILRDVKQNTNIEYYLIDLNKIKTSPVKITRFSDIVDELFSK